MEDDTTKQVERKAPNPTGIGGFRDHPENRNNGGRPRNPLKEYQREKFARMTDDEKEAFLRKISPEIRWKMAEGNPEQDTKIDGEITSKIISIDE